MRTSNLVLSISMAALFSGYRAVAAEPVRASVDLVLKTGMVGFPVLIKVRLQTTSLVRVNLGENRTGAISLFVQTPTISKKVSVPIEPGLRSLATFTLDPKYVYDETLMLPATFFSEVGRYNITLTIGPSDNPPFEYESGNSLPLTVLPYDQSAMERLCSELNHRLQQTQSADERIALSHALASVKDPVALPYLDASLGRGWAVDSILVDGIASIGNGNAVTTLARAAQSENADVSMTARAALARLERSSPQEEIRNQARLARASQAIR